MSANGGKKETKMTAELIPHCLKFHQRNKSSHIIQDNFIVSSKGWKGGDLKAVMED